MLVPVGKRSLGVLYAKYKWCQEPHGWGIIQSGLVVSSFLPPPGEQTCRNLINDHTLTISKSQQEYQYWNRQRKEKKLGKCTHAMENSICFSRLSFPSKVHRQHWPAGRNNYYLNWLVELWNFLTYSICFFSIFPFFSNSTWKDYPPSFFISPVIQKTLTFFAKG